MKTVQLLLFNLLIVVLGLAWLMLVPEPLESAGAAHPAIEGMRIGGDGAARFNAIYGPVVVIQIGTLGAMASLLVLPLARGRNSTMAVAFIHGIAFLCVLVWIAIVLSYDRYLQTGDAAFAFGFPFASTLAVYAVWGTGLLLSFFYVIGFDRFIYTPDDKAAFEAILRDADAHKDDA